MAILKVADRVEVVGGHKVPANWPALWGKWLFVGMVGWAELVAILENEAF